RCMAPVSTWRNPSRVARPRLALDLPARAGPSMATTSTLTQRPSLKVVDSRAQPREQRKEAGERHVGACGVVDRDAVRAPQPRDGERHCDPVVAVRGDRAGGEARV